MEAWPIDSDLHAYRHVPPDPRAAVLLLHGFGEHAGRHTAAIDVLGSHGIAVYTYDQRGHGRSPGRRGFIANFDRAVDDSHAMRHRICAKHPGLPMFLMGVSMGGLVAIRSAQLDSGGLAGVVLVAPALAIGDSTTPVIRAVGSLLAKIVPLAPVAALELAALSLDRSVADAYAADTLNYHGKISARSGAEMLAAASAAMAEAAQWRLPAYIVHGEADRIAPAAGSKRFVAAAAGADITLRLIPGAYHEPFNDPGGAALIDDVAAWIVERASHAAFPLGRLGARTSVRRRFTWWEGLAFGAAVNVAARLLGTNTGRYETIKRPWFAPPGWVFPVVWGVNSALAVAGNLRVLNAAQSTDRTAYLRLWAATWLLYISFGYVFFRRKSPVLGLLVTANFFVLSCLSAGRAVRIDKRLWLTYVTLMPWLALATAVAASVALENPDPLLDPPDVDVLTVDDDFEENVV